MQRALAVNTPVPVAGDPLPRACLDMANRPEWPTQRVRNAWETPCYLFGVRSRTLYNLILEPSGSIVADGLRDVDSLLCS